ncbi:hypothetical protein GCM10011613_31740 [Cellvibrio zantedeschiae]|uniref:Uncharacterized protein n=1 Tax=Cellvibrio zantedeschiae TaxID=1237077 RepID=A0ABQ3B910_9GAMM|nr:hypothetical protein [Cellvibrio zantedeschiae]GGY84461.1 hypothetical protein GCM10011613_31740 [Cellvibrio zantedeschiae]
MTNLITILLILVSVASIVMWGILVWSTYWPQVEGLLEKADYHALEINRRKLFKLDVLYKYELNGKSFKSNTIYMFGGAPCKSENEASGLIKSFNENLVITYCPMLPAISCILLNKKLMLYLPIMPILAMLVYLLAAFLTI